MAERSPELVAEQANGRHRMQEYEESASSYSDGAGQQYDESASSYSDRGGESSADYEGENITNNNTDEEQSSSDAVTTMWSIIFQLCTLIAVENLDETLSMPDNLISTTQQLLNATDLSYGFLGVVDLVVYHVLIDLAEKRQFALTSRAGPHSGPKTESWADDDSTDGSGSHSNKQECPFVQYCNYLQEHLRPLLTPTLVHNGVPSLVLSLLDDLYSSRCLFAIEWDPRFIPLAVGNPNNTLQDELYGSGYAAAYRNEHGKSFETVLAEAADAALSARCNAYFDPGRVFPLFEPVGGTAISEDAVDAKRNFSILNSSICAEVENRVHQRYPAAIVRPYGSAVNDMSSLQSDLDLVMVCADINNDNDPRWQVKEAMEDEYIADMAEARAEYNVYAAEIAANRLVEKVALAINMFHENLFQQLEQHRTKEQQFQQIMFEQQQYYNRFHRPMPLAAPMQPPQVARDNSVLMLAVMCSEADLRLLTGLSSQGTALLPTMRQQSAMYKSKLSLIYDHFDDLSALYARHIAGNADERTAVAQHTKHTLQKIKVLMERAASEASAPASPASGSAAKMVSGKSSPDMIAAGESGPHSSGGNSTSSRANGGGAVGGVRLEDFRLVFGSRVPLITFREVSSQRTCDLVLHQLIGIKNSELIKAYVGMDNSGLVRKYIMGVKAFVRAQHIGTAKSGFISTYAWTVMALHVLLRYRLLPCITPQALAGQHFYKGCDISFVDNLRRLPVAFESRLRQVSALQLMHLFFYYYSKVFDVQVDVVTLRRPSMCKQATGTARFTTQEWRLCIEDPFETVDSLFPHDLGATLGNQTKQAYMLKAMSSARKALEQSAMRAMGAVTNGAPAGAAVPYSASAHQNKILHNFRAGIDSIFDPVALEKWHFV